MLGVVQEPEVQSQKPLKSLIQIDCYLAQLSIKPAPVCGLLELVHELNHNNYKIKVTVAPQRVNNRNGNPLLPACWGQAQMRYFYYGRYI